MLRKQKCCLVSTMVVAGLLSFTIGAAAGLLRVEQFDSDMIDFGFWGGQSAYFEEAYVENGMLVFQPGSLGWVNTLSEYTSFALRIRFEMDIPEDRTQGVNRFMIGWYGEVWGIPGAAYGVASTPTAIEGLPMDMAIRVIYNNTGGAIEYPDDLIVPYDFVDKVETFDVIVATDNSTDFRVIVRDYKGEILADWSFSEETYNPGSGAISLTTIGTVAEIRIHTVVIGETLEDVESF